MRRLFIVSIAVVAALALVMPVQAADLKFGGLFEQVFYSTDNLRDGLDTGTGVGSAGDPDNDDNINVFKTRVRLYFSAIASENLKVHTKFEIDNTWGDGRLGTLSADGGSQIAGGSAQNTGMEIKNLYLDFTIPDTPLTFYVGTFGATLNKGIVFMDDTTGILAAAKVDALSFALVYSRLGDQATTAPTAVITGNSAGDDVDLWAGAVSYAMEGISAGFSVGYVNSKSGALGTFGGAVTNPFEEVDFYILAVDADVSMDMITAYLTAAINLGSDDGLTIAGTQGVDFGGYYVTAGGAFSMDMFTFGLDFFYTSGDEVNSSGAATDSDIDQFFTVGGNSRPSKYMDEAIFPGWLTDVSPLASNIWAAPSGANTTNITAGAAGTNAVFFFNNVLAVGAHVDVKPLEKTLVNVGGAYMMFAEDVVSQTGQLDNDLGFSAYARVSQGIVDGLVLKVTFGYFFAGDAYTNQADDDDAYRFGTALQWSW